MPFFYTTVLLFLKKCIALHFFTRIFSNRRSFATKMMFTKFHNLKNCNFDKSS
eukprot:UN21946